MPLLRTLRRHRIRAQPPAQPAHVADLLSRLATDPDFAARVTADPAAALAGHLLSAADRAAVEAVVAPTVPDPLSESGTRLRWLLEGAVFEGADLEGPVLERTDVPSPEPDAED